MSDDDVVWIRDVHSELLLDSDGFPVSPWHSRFVEVDERNRQTVKAVDAFLRSAAPIFEAMGEAIRRAIPSIVSLVDAFSGPQWSETESATRRAVQAQRRRRHR